jgi:hypothetical protein
MRNTGRFIWWGNIHRFMTSPSDLLGRAKIKPLLLGVLAVLAVGLFAAAAPAVAGDITAQDDVDVEQNNKSIDISLEHKAGTGLVPGEPQRYEVVVEGATDGIEAHDIDLVIEDSNVASFTQVETYNGTPEGDQPIEYDNSGIENGGSLLNLEIALGNKTFDTGQSEIVVADVWVDANADAYPGSEGAESVNITTANATVQDLNSEEYQDGDLSVGADVHWLDPDGDGSPAQDTTGDGLVDDVNGNGDSNVGDVIALFNALGTFDDELTPFVNFIGDSPEVNVGDVIALFNSL